MGNYKSKSDLPVSPPVAALFKTAETKSMVLLEKYCEERGVGNVDRGLPAVRLMRMWASGRSVGRRAVDKVVGEDQDGELSKVNKARLSWMLARLFGKMAGEGEKEVAAYCDFIRQEVEISFGQEEEEEEERLKVLSLKVGEVLKSWNEDEFDWESGLSRWSEWVAARVAAEVARGNLGEAFRLAREGKKKFEECYMRLEESMKERRLSLELKEMSYYTFPGEGMKRWWIDLMVTMVEREPK